MTIPCHTDLKTGWQQPVVNHRFGGKLDECKWFPAVTLNLIVNGPFMKVKWTVGVITNETEYTGLRRSDLVSLFTVLVKK